MNPGENERYTNLDEWLGSYAETATLDEILEFIQNEVTPVPGFEFYLEATNGKLWIIATPNGDEMEMGDMGIRPRAFTAEWERDDDDYPFARNRSR